MSFSISFFEKFIDHYSLLSVENIKSAIGQDKIDPKAKEYVDFELFWHDLLGFSLMKF